MDFDPDSHAIIGVAFQREVSISLLFRGARQHFEFVF